MPDHAKIVVPGFIPRPISREEKNKHYGTQTRGFLVLASMSYVQTQSIHVQEPQNAWRFLPGIAFGNPWQDGMGLDKMFDEISGAPLSRF